MFGLIQTALIGLLKSMYGMLPGSAGFSAGTVTATADVVTPHVDVVAGVSTTGVEGVKVSPTATGGLQTVVVDKTVSPSAVETAVFSVPAGSVIRLVQGNVQTALTGGGTTATWSLGTAGDPDKYGTAGYPTAADSLAKNSKSSWTATPTHLASAEAIVLTGSATGGAADGDTALTVGSVRVVIVYDTYESLADA